MPSWLGGDVYNQYGQVGRINYAAGGYNQASIARASQAQMQNPNYIQQAITGAYNTLDQYMARRAAAAAPPPPAPAQGQVLTGIARGAQVVTGIAAGAGLLQNGNGSCGCNTKCGPTVNTPWVTGPLEVPGEYADLNPVGNRCQDPCYPRFVSRPGITDRDVCLPKRKKPKMNPLNPRAATRAARRLTSLNKMTKKIEKAVRKACR